MEIALYRGVSRTSRLIRWWTRSEYSHAALILDDGRIVEAWHKPLLTGGAVRVIMDLSDGHTPNTPVDIFDLTGLTYQQAAVAKSFALLQLGKKYDWGAILGFITRTQSTGNQDKWDCSELIYAALSAAGYQLLDYMNPCEASPGDLARSPKTIKSDTRYTR